VKPDCMTPDELAGWEAANRLLYQPAQSPCQDCVPAFAVAMRAVGRCNGVPGEPVRLPSRVTLGRRESNRLAAQRWRERQRLLLDAARVGA
jgi:hypothetical protein